MGPEALIFVTLTLGLVGLLIALYLFVQWRQPRLEPLPPPLALEWCDVGAWRFRYHRTGQGPPLILLHGLGANLYCWRSLIPLLARRFTVVALDLPGFGQSSIHTRERYGLDEQVQRLRSFLHQLGINRSYLVGSSMGGNLALWYALEHPTEVLGLAVIAPATRPNLVPIMAQSWLWLSRPAALMINRWLMRLAHQRTVSKKHLVDRLRVEETFKTYGRNHAAIRSFLLATDSIRDPRLAARLVNLQIPPLILWGAQDRLVPITVIEAMKAAVAGHESHAHATGGHHLQEDEPEWVAEKIDAFFSKRRATSPT